jgi:N-acetylmuramoyl-L-alanine amidase
MDIGVAEIRQWHLDRGWLDIGYTYVIRRNGSVEKGRDLDNDGDVDEEIGAHALGHNSHSLGICLVGGMSEEGVPDSNFTLNQLVSLKNLIENLRDLYPDTELHGHRYY